MLPVYQAIADHVGERLQVSTELVVETDYESCARDENDVCFVCSLPYVMFERQGISPAEPVAAPICDYKMIDDDFMLAPVAAGRSSYSPLLFLRLVAAACALAFVLVRRLYHGGIRRSPP